eukprot:s4057_g4.t1
MSRAVLQVFEEYQKARVTFVQTVADLATRPQNIDSLTNAGVMALLRPLLLDSVASIQQSAALALGRMANYSEELAESVVTHEILPQLVYSLAQQNRYLDRFRTVHRQVTDLVSDKDADKCMLWSAAADTYLKPAPAKDVKALIQHAPEMGRSESILQFSAHLRFVRQDSATFDDEFAKDVRQQKFWEVPLVVYETGKIAANHLVSNYGLGGLRFVHRLIAEAMLGRMEDLLLESTEISEEVWSQAMECTYHLAYVLCTLTKPQRQKWVSQLVKALRSPESLQGRLQKDLFSSLQLLWRADDDPARSYAEADHQLKALLKQSSGRLQQEICKLLAC